MELADDGERLPILDPNRSDQVEEPRLQQLIRKLDQGSTIFGLGLFYLAAPFWELIMNGLFNLGSDSVLFAVFFLLAWFVSIVMALFIEVSMGALVVRWTYTSYVQLQRWGELGPPRPLQSLLLIIVRWIAILDLIYVVVIWYGWLKGKGISKFFTKVVLDVMTPRSLLAVFAYIFGGFLFQLAVIVALVVVIKVARVIAQYSPTFQRYVRARYPIL